jgi:RNA polymerase sigma factor (sigma-70 family)
LGKGLGYTRMALMSDPETQQTAAQAQNTEARAALVADLFREHNEALIRFLALRLRSQQAAREVAQEAYVRVLNLDRPGAVNFLRAFLFKTAANLAVDRIRHEQTTRQLARTGKLLDVFSTQASPEQAAASAQELALVGRLMNELPPKCRRAFFLHKIRGLDFAQIAQQMGLRERMVRNYVVRAVLYCRAGLDAARGTSSNAAMSGAAAGAMSREEDTHE